MPEIARRFLLSIRTCRSKRTQKFRYVWQPRVVEFEVRTSNHFECLTVCKLQIISCSKFDISSWNFQPTGNIGFKALPKCHSKSWWEPFPKIYLVQDCHYEESPGKEFSGKVSAQMISSWKFQLETDDIDRQSAWLIDKRFCFGQKQFQTENFVERVFFDRVLWVRFWMGLEFEQCAGIHSVWISHSESKCRIGNAEARGGIQTGKLPAAACPVCRQSRAFI